MGRGNERGGNAAKKIDDGKGWQKSCARDGTRVSPCAKRRRDSEDGKGGGGGVSRCTRLAHECERDGGEEGAGARVVEESDAARGVTSGTRGAHGRTGWMGAGTVFKRKEKERGESSEWLVHY